MSAEADSPVRVVLEGPGKNALSTALMTRALAEVRAAGHRPLLLTGAGEDVYKRQGGMRGGGGGLLRRKGRGLGGDRLREGLSERDRMRRSLPS